MSASPSLFLGSSRPLDGAGEARALHMPAHHLVTHGVVVGMTGSGKTGLLTVLVEETLNAGVPVLMIDVKGDLPNLLLAFPTFSAQTLEPWVEPGPGDARSRQELAEALAHERKTGLSAWGIDEPALARFHQTIAVRVITPGSSAGEALHVLSSLERPATDWKTNPEAARASLSAAISLVLRLLGRDPDPAKSREHVLLAVLAERRLRAGEPSNLGSLLTDLAHPPLERIGALTVDRFLPKRQRAELAAALNALLASPTFASWREGAALDVKAWFQPAHGRTPAVILSVAHLDDDERALVLGIVLEELLTYVRGLPGSKRLRALIVFDEVYGYLPPHPATPPTKRPLVSLMKQARAFGIGIVIATQNPMDLDYRALGNAGLWCVGRLQTDADRARVIEGLASSDAGGGTSEEELSEITKCLAPRWFVLRDVHARQSTVLMQPRWAMSFMRGPMTGSEIRKARGLGR
ncbi:MAG TPA: helicase HerA-like domain-containing protein [Polyangiaceae bacterium]